MASPGPKGYLRTWGPNANGLLFATRNGTPWRANLLVKRKLHPLLEQLQIARCGLPAFRHTNATLMDRPQVPMKLRRQRLGHNNPKVTLGAYAHFSSKNDERIAFQLSLIFWTLYLTLMQETKKLKSAWRLTPVLLTRKWLRGLDLNQRPSDYEHVL